MNNISVAFASTYGGRYMPMVRELESDLCYAYGIGFPRGYQFSDEPLNKMILTKKTRRISQFVVAPLCKILKKPDYYRYLSNVVLFDDYVKNKISNDESTAVLLNPLLCDTVEHCKKRGKFVICEAGNSEPDREFLRVSNEYNEFRIKNKYIYGDKKFYERVKKSFNECDRIVTVSKISYQTYRDAGYDLERLELVSMAGADVIPNVSYDFSGRKKAFISTSFHSFIKGTHRLLLAWKKANISNVPLIIVGRLCGDMREFVERFGPFENVIFAGYQKDLSLFYKQYDACGVLMSLSEGAVRVTPEMMRYGFPMLVSPDATCDVVKDGVNGFVVDPFDVDMLAEKLKAIANDWNIVDSLRSNISGCIINRTMTDYSLDLAKYIKSFI